MFALNSSGDKARNQSVNIIGSNVVATNNLGILTDELNVTSSIDKSNFGQDTEHGGLEFSWMFHSGFGLNATYDRSRGRNSDKVNNNSKLFAKNITIITTGDSYIRGGNVNASKHLEAYIGGNLNIESQKDYKRSKSNNFGISAGISWGSCGADKNGPTAKKTGVSSLSFGASKGKSRSNSSQVVVVV